MLEKCVKYFSDTLLNHLFKITFFLNIKQIEGDADRRSIAHVSFEKSNFVESLH